MNTELHKVQVMRFTNMILSTRRWVVAALVLAASLSTTAYAQTYSYDAQGRLTTVVYDDGSSLQYELDAMGNLLTLAANEPLPSAGGGGGGGGCFIATAAYGSILDPHVQALRDFRDTYMLTNAPGRWMIAFYERTSPPIAAVIAEVPALRFLTQLILAPIVYAASYPRLALAILVSLLFLRFRRRLGVVRRCWSWSFGQPAR